MKINGPYPRREGINDREGLLLVGAEGDPGDSLSMPS